MLLNGQNGPPFEVMQQMHSQMQHLHMEQRPPGNFQGIFPHPPPPGK